MILSDMLRHTTAQLQQAGIDSALLDARLLMQYVLGCDHATLISKHHHILSDEQQIQFNALFARRLKREPLTHILGYRDFWKDQFIVTADVLDPRPDSETLIEAVIEHLPDREKNYTILDLGTGSGCLLLSVLREYQNAEGKGLDISSAALNIATKNAISLGLKDRTHFIEDNWGKSLHSVFDVIITNPPYIADDDINHLAPEVREYEPRLALSGKDDGLAAYRALAPELKRLLLQDGLGVIELGEGQRADVARIMEQQGLHVKDCKEDLAGIERALIVTH